MIPLAVRQFVFERADRRCEYCYSPISHSISPFVVEHIDPSSGGGSDDLENLACACGGCNGHKYTKTQALDPFSGLLVPLFNPRTMLWTDHFLWSDDFSEMIGITDIGRATVDALQLNRTGVLNIRRLLFLDGLHPPKTK